MVQIVLDITDYCIIYGTYFVLFVFVYLFINNFVSHFRWNYECPYIVRDEEVNGIYPTLLMCHVLISLSISSFIAAITHNDEYYMAHSTFTFASCYLRFAIFSTDILAATLMDNGYSLLLLCALSILCLLETYFSYSRYYGCATVVQEFTVPSKWRVFRPYIAYILLLLVLIWCAVSMIPILMLFVCILHLLINSYFSYFFYAQVKLSYAHVFEAHQELRFSGDAYEQMQQQIKQIRSVFHLAMMSALISAFVILSFSLCSALRFVPFGLCGNTLCLYLMLTKNRLLLESTLRCECATIHELMCVVPWSIIEKRKASAFPHPSTLMKIKTSSLKVLRGIPKQMTPVLNRIRTSNSNLKVDPPPNTPRFSSHGQTPSDLNLGIINEEKRSHSHTNTTSSQKRISTTQTQSSDGIELEIITNSAKISSRSRHLKPYSLTTSSLVSSDMSGAGSGRLSIDYAMHSNLNQLDTIPAEDEMITFANATPKPYRSRRHHSNVSMPCVYPDETDIVEGFDMLQTYGEDADDDDEGIYFARMKNIRATMREDHIAEIKHELALFVDMKEEEEEEEEVEEEDQRTSLKKRVQQIELTKEELQKEKKVLQLKKKTNKRIAFGADMALEIVQESITKQDEKRKAVQHEFYVTAIMMDRAASAHQMTPCGTPRTSNKISLKLKAPKVTPAQTPRRQRSLVDDVEELNISAAHIRSRSDDQMIVEIANQMARHAKQISLKKTGSERSRKVNRNNKKKKDAAHPRPKLNPKSASEDVETHKKQRADAHAAYVKTHGTFLSPNDATPSLKPSRKYDDDDDMSHFDVDASPSPPPEAYLDAMSVDPNDLSSSQHSMWQTFRSFGSWLSPSMRLSTRHSSREDSERANNLNFFLKQQGLATMRSDKKRFSEMIAPIEAIPEHERVVHLDIDQQRPGAIQEEDEENQESTAL